MISIKKGFTLVEVLLVIGIIAILASVVIIAINPAKQIASARDLQRTSDLNNINNALVQYQINNKGLLPVTLPVIETEICDTGNKPSSEILAGDCGSFVNLSFLVPDYLVSIPKDPSILASSGLIKVAKAAGFGNGYILFRKNQRIVLIADRAETRIITLNAGDNYPVKRISVGHDVPATPAWACGDVLNYQGDNYPTINIGGKCWFAANLATTKYRNGEDIPYYGAGSAWYEWNNLIGKFSYLNNDSNNRSDYGALYNWYAATDSRFICPTGWHLSTETDWNNLETALNPDAGSKLKVSSSFKIPWDGNNQSGFTAVPSGARWSDGSFTSWATAYYWTDSSSGNTVNTRQLAAWSNSIAHVTDDKSEGLAIRCVQD